MNLGSTRRFVLMSAGLLPGSKYILDSIATWLFKSFEPLTEIAENIITARREGGDSARKVRSQDPGKQFPVTLSTTQIINKH